MFRCKQFTVHQDRCAMKVSTDSLLLGSWCQPQAANSILDIGSGTGILSLMLAQKSLPDCQITALEIDAEAAAQAQQNIADSPWPNKLTVVHQNFLNWSEKQQHLFDLVIANPPWFEVSPAAKHNATNQIRSASRTAARQQGLLNLSRLFESVAGLLAENGRFCLVLPAQAESQVLTLAPASGLVTTAMAEVRATPEKPPYCQLWQFNKIPDMQQARPLCVDEIIVRDTQGQYTPQYKALCQAYYLNF